MKSFLISLFFILQQVMVNAQTGNEPAADTAIYTVVEENAKFPGGDAAMKIYIAEHLQYPKSKVAGNVYVSFVVEKDGSLTHLKAMRGIPGCTVCTEKALDVIKSMPAWISGTHRGVQKRTQCIVPVSFSSATPASSGRETAIDLNNTDLVFTVVEHPPTFPGGEEKMTDYIKQNLHHPPAAYKEGRAGISYITFIVEKDGTLSDIHILKGASGGSDLDEEAIRLVRSMPKWNPGKQNDHVVRCYYNLPIRFLR